MLLRRKEARDRVPASTVVVVVVDLLREARASLLHTLTRLLPTPKPLYLTQGALTSQISAGTTLTLDPRHRPVVPQYALSARPLDGMVMLRNGTDAILDDQNTVAGKTVCDLDLAEYTRNCSCRVHCQGSSWCYCPHCIMQTTEREEQMWVERPG